MYHLGNNQLRVCGKYLRQKRNRIAFTNSRIIILQHILSDTENLIGLLDSASAEIFIVIAKPYSIDNDVYERLGKKYRIICNSYDELENTPILDDILKDAIEKSEEDNKKILIIEVGGYFAVPLTRLKDNEIKYFAGVVEDTTFGHNRYVKLVNEIKIPIFSVARSPLKEIEAKFVGDSAVSAVNQILRESGATISSRNALVIGYGMIGQSIADSLRAKNLHVSVYDKDDHRNLNAFSHGFSIHKKLELLKLSDIVFSATGTNALSTDDIEFCKDGCLLVSAGSKDIEFDVQGLRDLAFNTNSIGNYIEEFELTNSHKVYLLHQGTAVNFLIKSVPDEIIDLVFAEIIICSLLLLKKDDITLNLINNTPKQSLNEISKEWLKDVNS